MTRFTTRIASGILSLSLAATMLGIATPAQAGRRTTTATPRFGVQFHAMWSDYTDAERVAVLDKMAAAGIDSVRIDFGWSSLQPTGPDSYAQWYIDRADSVVNEARARGLKVLMTLWRTPNWANGGGGPYVPPSNPADYGRAAKWVSDHFRGRVMAWEVWNEPNLAGGRFWTGSATDYANLLKASYSKSKAGDAQAKVVAGSVVYNDDVWLGQMYAAGAQGYFDVIATHPYQGVADEPPEASDNGTKWRLSHVPAVHSLMCRYGDCDKPIWFTEMGWSSHSNTGNEGNWERGVTLQRQADYAVRAIKYVRTDFPYVTKMFWYSERNKVQGSIQGDNYGLLYRDLSSKPVYSSLKAFLTN